MGLGYTRTPLGIHGLRYCSLFARSDMRSILPRFWMESELTASRFVSAKPSNINSFFVNPCWGIRYGYCGGRNRDWLGIYVRKKRVRVNFIIDSYYFRLILSCLVRMGRGRRDSSSSLSVFFYWSAKYQMARHFVLTWFSIHLFSLFFTYLVYLLDLLVLCVQTYNS